MNEFWKRTLSGAVYVAVVVGMTIGVPTYFQYMTAILALLAVREFHLLMGDRHRMMATSAIAASMISLIVPLYLQGEDVAIPCAAYLTLIIMTMVSELFAKQNPIENWGRLLIAQVMIGLPFATMNVIEQKSPWLMLALFVIIWVNDSGAYCVGSLMSKRKGGNHKMFPRVSPGKSWEGLAGGIVAAITAGGVFAVFVPEIAVWMWLLLALAISMAGTLGDLMESIFKRTLGVKDSGRFMPGHGGVLDRFDSLLLATPVVFVLLLLL